MHLSSIEWYNSNEGRKFPLIDTCSAVSVTGEQLPSDLLVDMNISIPDPTVSYVYVSSVVVSEAIVSVTLGYVRGNGTYPLAAISVDRSESSVHRNLRLEPYVDGVVGWIVLGAGITNRIGNWRFSSPTSTQIVSRCLHKFSPIGVTSLRVDGAEEKLTGTVEFMSSDPQILRVYRDRRSINGTMRDCIIFGLNTLNESVDTLSRYVGKCFKSPDSETCARDSMYSINHATPNCNGVVFLNIIEKGGRNLLTLRKVGDSHLYLDYGVGLSGICDKFEVSQFPSKVDECDEIDLTDRPLAGILYGENDDEDDSN